MAKAKKSSRPGRRLERKSEAWFPLRRPALLAALGLAGWAPAAAAVFPPTLNLSTLDGTNGFRLNGVAAGDYSGGAVSSAGDVNGDGLAASRADPSAAVDLGVVLISNVPIAALPASTVVQPGGFQSSAQFLL